MACGRRVVTLFSLVLLGAVLAVAWLYLRPPKLKWLVCYDAALPASAFAGADWAVVDAAFEPKGEFNNKTRFIGYVSVGEAEEYRDYWERVRDADFVLEANPNWPGNRLVDVRSPDWQNLLLGEVVAGLVRKGFDGVFLDTLDVAAFLEERDAVRFKGAQAAVVGWVKSLRARHPDLLIVANNGLDILPELASTVDAVAVEDLHTHHDFASGKSVPTDPAIRDAKEKILDAFIKATGKPVLNILYETSTETDLARAAIARSEAKGYLWYLTGVDLMKVGVMNR